MDQTDRNALDYESCRRVWRRVSPELDPYPEEKEATDCPAAPAPDMKGLQEMIDNPDGSSCSVFYRTRIISHLQYRDSCTGRVFTLVSFCLPVQAFPFVHNKRLHSIRHFR